MPNIVIIGSGPAGVSAALYAARAGVQTTVLTKGPGALDRAELIQNYYGFAEPITGAELERRGIEGAKAVGVEFVTTEAVGLTYTDKLTVETLAGDFPADAVILATGASRAAPRIPGLAGLEGHGVRAGVDATQDLLVNVLPYHPFLIKPNNHELGEIVGRVLNTEDEIVAAARTLQEKGARNVLVSMAGDGALLLDEQGQTHMTLGFTVYGLKKTPLNVLKESANSVIYYGRIIYTSLADLLRGRESINDLSGPVGIVTAIGQAASYGWEDVAELLVLITINLGVFNLLPFPALDGGKIVFLLIEAVTGHAVPEKIQSSLTVAAFALLFGLMLFATYNDIVRLVTGAV